MASALNVGTSSKAAPKREMLADINGRGSWGRGLRVVIKNMLAGKS